MITRLSAMFGCVSLAMSLSFATGAHAKDIYRWVDEQGRTQISDTVPPQYKKNAIRVDTRASQVSESDRALAVERAAKEKAAADSKQTATNVPRAGDPVPRNRPAVSGSDESASCDQLRRAYAESQACFAPYHTAHGAVKAEAYQRCTQVPDPSSRCGSPSTSHVDD